MQGTSWFVIAFEIAPTTFSKRPLVPAAGAGWGEGHWGKHSHAQDALKLCFQQFFSYKCVS